MKRRGPPGSPYASTSIPRNNLPPLTPGRIKYETDVMHLKWMTVEKMLSILIANMELFIGQFVHPEEGEGIGGIFILANSEYHLIRKIVKFRLLK